MAYKTFFAMEIHFNTTTQEYIEVIHDLEKENKVARVKDIANRRGVTRSSVSLELNNLVKKELIFHEQYGHVTLTPAGRKLAATLEHRHMLIKTFLVNFMGIDEKTGENEACKLEHIIDSQTLAAITRFSVFMKSYPNEWNRLFQILKDCDVLNHHAVSGKYK